MQQDINTRFGITKFDVRFIVRDSFFAWRKDQCSRSHCAVIRVMPCLAQHFLKFTPRSFAVSRSNCITGVERFITELPGAGYFDLDLGTCLSVFDGFAHFRFHL